MKLAQTKHFIATVLLAGMSSVGLAAKEPHFHITDVETLATDQLQATVVEDQQSMIFSAFGQVFDVRFRQNPKIHQHIDNAKVRADGSFFAGTLRDKPGSWVRLANIDGRWSGAIFDGAEMYFIDTLANFQHDLDPELKREMDQQATDTLIVRGSDMRALGTCAVHDLGQSGNVVKDFTKNLRTNSPTSQVLSNSQSSVAGSASALATRQVNIAVVTDTEYNDAVNGSVTNNVLAQMNVVEGIFDSQVNLEFGISEVRVLNNNGSLTSRNASTLLTNFRSFVNSNIGNPGLAHLFTGKDMNGGTIGIAFLSAACTTSGVGLSEAARGSIGSLIVAHEIGHNTGAPHDNQSGSSCGFEPGTFLMNPSINGSDEFSGCSRTRIDSYLSGVSCLVPPDGGDPPPPSGNCEFSANFSNGSADNFVFLPDAQTPQFTVGSVAGGRLNVDVGGINNADVTNMTGIWQRACNASGSGTRILSFDARMIQASDYESDEFSEIVVGFNNGQAVLARLTGNGNGGADQDTGFDNYRFRITLQPGDNILSLSCFNNKKTFNNEDTRCQFDNVTIE